MKKLTLIIFLTILSLNSWAQCAGVSATGTSRYKVFKSCYDTVVVHSQLNDVTMDTARANKATIGVLEMTGNITDNGGTLSIDPINGDLYNNSGTNITVAYRASTLFDSGLPIVGWADANLNGLQLSNLGATYAAFIKNSNLTGNVTLELPSSTGTLALTSNINAAVSGTSGQVSYFNGTNTITSEAAFAYNNTTDVLTLTGSEVVDTLSGSTSSGGNLQLQSTTHATKGKILFGSGSAYDGVSGFLGVGTQSPSGLLNLSGNFTTSAWTTNGVRLRAASQTFTDNSSSGNVANVYMDVFGTSTYAASNPVTVTGNLIGTYYMVPAAGANVTAPNLFSLGTQGNILSGGSIQLNNGGTNTGFTVPNATNFRIQTGGSNVQRLVITGSTGLIGVGPTAPTPTAHLHVAANTASNSSFRIEESATDPSSPNAGDVWNNAGLIKQRTGGVTYIISKTLTNTATLDFGSTVAGAATDLTMTVTGAASGDVCAVGVPTGSSPTNGAFSCWVSAADTVTVRFINPDVLNPMDPASGTFRVSVIKY